MKASGTTSRTVTEADLAAPPQLQTKRRGRKSKLDPALRKLIKNRRDRERRAKEKVELQRLKNVEIKYNEMMPEFEKMKEFKGKIKEIENVNTGLRRENEELKSKARNQETEIQNLKSQIQNLKSQIKELHEKLESWLQSSPVHIAANYDNFDFSKILSPPSHCENAANTQGPKSSQGEKTYSDELVQDFTRKLDANEKSQVKISDFKGLMEEVARMQYWDTLPPSLLTINMIIKKKYGEIDAESKHCSWVAMATRTLLCAAIKEMNELRLEDIDEEKMLLWRDAINNALNMNFKVEFAMNHLKKIARAYFGLKASNDRSDQDQIKSLEQMMSTLNIELLELKSKHAEKVKEQNSTVRKECLLDAEYFQGKTLATGLFD
ncbi:hypothetical protein CCACVL1_13392 [Corchorus capsularis]|uniref:BZIP domain-containing protein n=1 Tax=Corchorus capsularis TaxID=210143 RepID=A0A1R3IB69_COCAP|nr:hypothetical protein CCACVL1_13392 [Corchorus capsularis]